jgi:hypothetical protein
MEGQADPRQLALLAALAQAGKKKSLKDRLKSYISMEYYKHWILISVVLFIAIFHLWPR